MLISSKNPISTATSRPALDPASGPCGLVRLSRNWPSHTPADLHREVGPLHCGWERLTQPETAGKCITDVSIKGKTALSMGTSAPSLTAAKGEQIAPARMDHEGGRQSGARPAEVRRLFQLTSPLQEDSKGVHRACGIAAAPGTPKL